MRLVLDAEALNALLDPRHPAERKVRRAMEAARRLRREVAVATGPLAGLYRGAGRDHALDALLAGESGDGLLLRGTDRTLARLIGDLLAEAGASSALSRTPIPSRWRPNRVAAWSRLPTPMTSPVWPPRTGRWSSSRWAGEGLTGPKPWREDRALRVRSTSAIAAIVRLNDDS